MSQCAEFALFVPGPPRGAGRPRFARAGNGVRTFTDAATRSYAQLVQGEWIAAGRPVLPDGPYRIELLAALDRPEGHFRRDGLRLSAAGRRAPWPTRAPDVDNLAKIFLDSLCAVGALPDDRKLVDLRVAKSWGAHEGVHVRAWASLLPDDPDAGGGARCLSPC